MLLLMAPVSAAVPVPQVAGVPMRAPHANPAIFRIAMPGRDVHSGQIIHASVITSSNVASVEARVRGFGVNLRHVGVGRFALQYQVPWLPFFLKGEYPVRVIARNVDGVATEKVLTVHYQ